MERIYIHVEHYCVYFAEALRYTDTHPLLNVIDPATIFDTHTFAYIKSNFSPWMLWPFNLMLVDCNRFGVFGTANSNLREPYFTIIPFFWRFGRDEMKS